MLSSILISIYRDDITPTLGALPAQLQAPALDGAAAAPGAAAGFGPAGATLVEAARAAFAAGLSTALWVGSGVLTVAAALCAVLAPGHPAVRSDPADPPSQAR